MADLHDITDAPLPVLPARQADSHKGDFGRALLIGGSRGMSGAISMTGLATLRSGAGLVTLAVPESIQNVVASFSPCFMTYGLPESNGQLTKLATGNLTKMEPMATAVAVGPGLGRSDSLTDVIEELCGAQTRPTVFDADALFAIAERQHLLDESSGWRVLTPHPGEFERLAGKRQRDGDRAEAAAALARRDKKKQTVIVLKGHETVITDGTRYSLNKTGNPGMATGGSGDVLTGVITALLCQGLEPFDAARLGVHVHGLAGDLAALELGQVSLIATDLLDYLPQAFQSIAE
jgi:ADP-dependent NAD(P)H-hydrate dehydratase